MAATGDLNLTRIAQRKHTARVRDQKMGTPLQRPQEQVAVGILPPPMMGHVIRSAVLPDHVEHGLYVAAI